MNGTLNIPIINESKNKRNNPSNNNNNNTISTNKTSNFFQNKLLQQKIFYLSKEKAQIVKNNI